MMRAENLTISIPADCSRDCPYCISKMTWAPPVNKNVFWRNLSTALHTAEQSGVSKILLTSKGEPMNERQWVIDLLQRCDGFITELQTNGEYLLLHPHEILTLAAAGLNVFALSIDELERLKNYRDIFKAAEDVGVTIRVTAIMTNAKDYDNTLTGIIKYAAEMGVHQWSFRVPTVPDVYGNNAAKEKAGKWIRAYYDEEWAESIQRCLYKFPDIRQLNFNATIYDVHGVSVTSIPNCVQEFSEDDQIRSLIYHQDGHMYTSWASPGSRIF